MIENLSQYALFLILVILLAVPCGQYLFQVMQGRRTIVSRLVAPCERKLCQLLSVTPEAEMSWREYAMSVGIFTVVNLLIVFLLQIFQGYLPGNPQQAPGMRWDLAINGAVSFVTNTNWQAYSGELQASYLLQILAYTVQNFVAAATGIAVLFAVIRGFSRVQTSGLGNFWVDLIRIVLHVLLPFNFVLTLLLVGSGVVHNFQPATTAKLVEPVAVSAEGKLLEDAVIDLEKGTVTLHGQVMPDAAVITEQYLPMGPAASQVAIKQTGTNGGGFFGTNSAHPLENPGAFSNVLELLSILLLPAALCFTFGKGVEDIKQGRALFAAMFLCLVLALGAIAASEQLATPQLAQNGAVNITTVNQAGGNMEGKESRFGIASSATWAAFTTAASSGSVNSMHDSYTPLGGLVQLVLMQLGEVIFGGVGSGLYGMLAFALLTVFIAGLMVGRTPEFLGKKIGAYEMKWAVICCLASPVAVLIGSGIAALLPQTAAALLNHGPHGFSELLYAFSSTGGNNGSAFAGFKADTLFFNLSLALVMLFARFVPMYAVLAIAGSLVEKKRLAISSGTLVTSNAIFVFLLLCVVFLLGALSFLPALALGPLAEFFSGM